MFYSVNPPELYETVRKLVQKDIKDSKMPTKKIYLPRELNMAGSKLRPGSRDGATVGRPIK